MRVEILAETLFAHLEIRARKAKGIWTNYVNDYNGELDKDRAVVSWYLVYL